MSKALRDLEEWPAVDVSPEGTFKYVLIEATAEDEQGGERVKLLVRGFVGAEFHADVYDAEEEKLRAAGLDGQCLGGGRIRLDAGSKRILVYGYSVGFGRADHSKTVEVLKARFPDHDITWSDEGY